MVKVADLMPASSPSCRSLISVLKSLLLGPAQVHAHQHLRPVLAFRAAGAGVDGDNGVQRIGLAVEHGAGFQLFVERGQSLDIALQIGEHVFALARQLEISFDVAGAADERLIVGDKVLQALALAHQRLRRGRVVPQCRIGKFGFEVG